jgi:hypothetical protein
MSVVTSDLSDRQSGPRLQAPIEVVLAVTLTVVEHLILIVLRAITVVGVASWVVVILMAALTVRGSRVAWSVLVVWAITALPAPWLYGQPYWVVGTASVTIALLISEKARVFVWKREGSG